MKKIIKYIMIAIVLSQPAQLLAEEETEIMNSDETIVEEETEAEEETNIKDLVESINNLVERIDQYIDQISDEFSDVAENTIDNVMIENVIGNERDVNRTILDASVLIIITIILCSVFFR